VRSDSFPPEFLRRVVDVAPTLMAAKYSRPKTLLDSLAAAKGRVHFLPHDGGVAKFAELSPATTTACWSTAASMGPEPVLEQMRALLSNDASATPDRHRPGLGKGADCRDHQ
jgi:hypothetical protein